MCIYAALAYLGSLAVEQLTKACSVLSSGTEHADGIAIASLVQSARADATHYVIVR